MLCVNLFEGSRFVRGGLAFMVFVFADLILLGCESNSERAVRLRQEISDLSNIIFAAWIGVVLCGVWCVMMLAAADNAQKDATMKKVELEAEIDNLVKMIDQAKMDTDSILNERQKFERLAPFMRRLARDFEAL